MENCTHFKCVIFIQIHPNSASTFLHCPASLYLQGSQSIKKSSAIELLLKVH